MSAEVVVVCDERAADCRCIKPAGHVEAGDPVHGCHPDRCTGEWSGVMDTATFRVVNLPVAVRGPVPWEFA